MGFTQRQAAGKFTSEEADEFIERLQSEAHDAGTPVAPARSDPPGTDAARPSEIAPRPPASGRPPARPRVDIALDEVPTEVLAAELQRRGWVVLDPD